MSGTCNGIGEAAGKIYKALEKGGAKKADALLKDSGIKDAAVFNQAIGWLARENNVQFTKKGTSTLISLVSCGATCCK